MYKHLTDLPVRELYSVSQAPVYGGLALRWSSSSSQTQAGTTWWQRYLLLTENTWNRCLQFKWFNFSTFAKTENNNFPLGLKPTFQACLISSVLLSGHARLTRCARDLQEARADRPEHTCTERASIMHQNSVYIHTGSIAEHICVVNICVCVETCISYIVCPLQLCLCVHMRTMHMWV